MELHRNLQTRLILYLPLHERHLWNLNLPAPCCHSLLHTSSQHDTPYILSRAIYLRGLQSLLARTPNLRQTANDDLLFYSVTHTKNASPQIRHLPRCTSRHLLRKNFVKRKTSRTRHQGVPTKATQRTSTPDGMVPEPPCSSHNPPTRRNHWRHPTYTLNLPVQQRTQQLPHNYRKVPTLTTWNTTYSENTLKINWIYLPTLSFIAKTVEPIRRRHERVYST